MSQKVILDQSVKRITRAAMPIFGTFFSFGRHNTNQ